MARYKEFTQKQLEALDPLMKEAAHLQKKYDEITGKLAKKLITAEYEENQRLRKMARQYKQSYEDKQAEINYIINAREEFEDCLKKASRYCKRAENLKKTWGFE